MSNTEQMSATPWYRQFWPWFLIALPASVVVAGLTTVYIAFNNADTLVRDNYYRDGLAINKELDKDRNASNLGVSSELYFDSVTGEVIVTVAGLDALPSQMVLQLLHPLEERRDQTIELRPVGDDRYRGDLSVFPSTRFYVRLAPDDGAWRLNGEIDFDKSDSLRLLPAS